jgi:hypothetical protein
LSEESLGQQGAGPYENGTSTSLKLGIILLVVFLFAGQLLIRLDGTMFSIGGWWGFLVSGQAGLQVYTIAQQLANIASSSWATVVAIFLSLCLAVLGILALYSILKADKKWLKYTSLLLLIAFVANLGLALSQGASFSSWFAITPELVYINFGDVLLASAIFAFLTESYGAQLKALFKPEMKKPYVAGAQVSRIVQCHVCPLREVCREGNVEISRKLERLHKAASHEAFYAEMLRVTMNCPLKKAL